MLDHQSFETITYAMPKRTRIITHHYSKFSGMQVDVLHPRIFRFDSVEKGKKNVAQSARVYGRRVGQKFRAEVIEHDGSEVVAVWRIA